MARILAYGEGVLTWSLLHFVAIAAGLLRDLAVRSGLYSTSSQTHRWLGPRDPSTLAGARDLYRHPTLVDAYVLLLLITKATSIQDFEGHSCVLLQLHSPVQLHPCLFTASTEQPLGLWKGAYCGWVLGSDDSKRVTCLTVQVDPVSRLSRSRFRLRILEMFPSITKHRSVFPIKIAAMLYVLHVLCWTSGWLSGFLLALLPLSYLCI